MKPPNMHRRVCGNITPEESKQRAAEAHQLEETPKENMISLMILPQVHLRKPCYDFYFL